MKKLKIYLKRKFCIPLSIPELIDITIENQYLFEKGLCEWLEKLYCDDKLNYNEYSRLFDCILENNQDRCTNVFWWREGDIKPRIEFLEQLKLKYENK